VNGAEITKKTVYSIARRRSSWQWPKINFLNFRLNTVATQNWGQTVPWSGEKRRCPVDVCIFLAPVYTYSRRRTSHGRRRVFITWTWSSYKYAGTTAWVSSNDGRLENCSRIGSDWRLCGIGFRCRHLSRIILCGDEGNKVGANPYLSFRLLPFLYPFYALPSPSQFS